MYRDKPAQWQALSVVRLGGVVGVGLKPYMMDF
jgi:hypothetical protein